jgi:hypothetical protein
MPDLNEASPIPLQSDGPPAGGFEQELRRSAGAASYQLAFEESKVGAKIAQRAKKDALDLNRVSGPGSSEALAASVMDEHATTPNPGEKVRRSVGSQKRCPVRAERELIPRGVFERSSEAKTQTD